MSEIKGFAAKIHDQNPRQGKNTQVEMNEDFNSALIKNLQELKSIEDQIDNLSTEPEVKSPSSLDSGVKSAGVLLKDIEGIWENLKEKRNQT